MSEYTEADVLNAIKTMGLFRTSYPKDVVEKVVNNALNIANRFEHADVTKHKKAYYNHDDSEHGDGYCIGFQDGYELALADIRGNKE